MWRFRWKVVDPLDPVQNSVRPQNERQYNDFRTFCRNWGAVFDPNLKKTWGKSLLDFFAQSGPWPQKSPPPKSRFLKKIFYNLVFLISSRAQTGAVHTNSTRRIFLNRSQGFLTSFLGVKADWKSYFENYKKKGARSSAPDRWILWKIGRGIVWEGSWTPKSAKKVEKSGNPENYRNPGSWILIPQINFFNQ